MTDYEERTSIYARNLRLNLIYKMTESKPIKIIELAEMSGVSITTISRIKNDWQGKEHIDLKTIAKLEVALGLEPYELLTTA